MSLSHLITSLGWTLLHFVWQGALIACATAALLAALRNARPERRYAVACTALLLCLAWPLAELVHLLHAQPVRAKGMAWARAGVALPPSASGTGLAIWLDGHLHWIVTAWAVCASLLALRMAFGLAWVGRMRHAQPTDAGWQQRLSMLAQGFGLTREVRLRVVDGLASPVTAGWWRPVVLVPAALLTGMTPDLLEALLAHELAHIRRHDYLVNLVQSVIETLLFYHPAVWWLSRRIRAERELVADALAAQGLGEPRRLARALSELERVQFAGGHLALAASDGDLAVRVQRLVRPESQALHWKAALPILALAFACFANVHVTVPDASRATAARKVAATVDFASCTKPNYPHDELVAGHEGKVLTSFLVGADGEVRDSKISRSSGYPSLDEAARSAITKCRFHPAQLDGKPVTRWQPVMYVWTLE